jgi:hypothetical protein
MEQVDGFQQLGMRDTPEVIREVGIHDFRVAVKQRLLHRHDRLLGIAPRAVSVLLGGEVGFKDRLQHQHRCCHADPIAQGRDAQGPEIAIGVGNEDTSDRLQFPNTIRS